VRKRPKLTTAERRKRQERNERRGRSVERKSDDKPQIVKMGMVYGAPGSLARETESRQRAIMATVDHAAKWKDAPPCGCSRCVERRALEAEITRRAS
jgi:hypothetical protein